MKKKSKLRKSYLCAFVRPALAALFLCALFQPGARAEAVEQQDAPEVLFCVYLNGQEVGTVTEEERAEALFREARRTIAAESDELVFLDAAVSCVGAEAFSGEADDEALVLAKMTDVMRGCIQETAHRSYSVKVKEYTVNLAGIDDVEALLQAAVDKYDEEHLFCVEFSQDTEREFDVLTSRIVAQETMAALSEEPAVAGGVEDFMLKTGSSYESDEEPDFEDYELGLLSMNFVESVDIVEVYLPESQLSSLEAAVEELVMEQETAGEYIVKSGDTLSEIAIEVNIPMDEIVAMNEELESINTPLQIGQKLIITVPEPQLSLMRTEQIYREEIYDEDIVYVDNNDWYTTQTKVLQQPSAGFRKIVADVTYLNDQEYSRDILKEEVLFEAVAKVVERGTRIPPTYIKPISGGRKTSGFGYRNKPTAGATSNHKGVDWATPVGTPVYASCGGVVTKAGWGSGYGYVVFINHDDGRQTRYAHLSKVLVSSGQHVKQGERIALSGNTGVSTGPHIHFEILIGGKQVDPLKYITQ